MGVVDGMDTVMHLFRDYGDGPPRGKGPDQKRIQLEGNNYLEVHFPLMSYIDSASISGVDKTWRKAAEYEDEDEDLIRVARPILIVLPLIVVALAAFACVLCRLRRAFAESDEEARHLKETSAKKRLPQIPRMRTTPKAQQIPETPLE